MIFGWITAALGKIAAPWARILAELFIILAIIAAIFFYGWHIGDNRAEDACAAQKTESSAARVASLTALLHLGPDPTNQSGVLASQQQQTRIVYQTIRERVPYVVNRYVSTPNPAPGYVYCPISHGIVSVWNDALAGHASLPAASGQSSGAAAGTDPAENQDSGISIGDLIDNHSANSEQCKDIRDELDALITWHEDSKERR